MCGYSLEMEKSRPARADEDLTIKQFRSSSKGFVAPEDADCAVCLETGVELVLHFDKVIEGAFQHIETKEHAMIVLEGDMPVTFHETESYTYRDGFKLASGHFVLLQALPVGTRATVTKPLPVELTDAVEAPVAFDPDTTVETTVYETV
jgi:hypothetical protein